MDIAEILRHILIVLVAAKLAAEVAERVGVPAVVGEILAGIVVGPSMLNAVGHGDEVLRTLGEIGVILLLLEVGMEMDLKELAKVGRVSMQVATVGVVAPMVSGMVAMGLMGEEFNTALFVGAALTATSVGITARVFGDLRALATTEARVVLGAAVADDVMGLIVLTVVVRLVTEGSVSVLSVLGIIAVAVAFLVVGGLVGLLAAPRIFSSVDKVSRSTGTMVAMALAFTLAFAELADLAKLAPIVGAFVAGIALARTRQASRIHRELGPVGHLFIPVFFLQIGIDADIEVFFKASVLRDAAILLVVAIVGKLLAPIGAIGSPGDKPLIGLGMLPRGEVGLIFATLGLQNGVLNEELYGALLLVVLVTTLVSPQLLKIRYAQIRGNATPVSTPDDAPTPDGGWLAITRDEVELAGRPPEKQKLSVALDAAVMMGRRRPGSDLLDWLAEGAAAGPWTTAHTGKLLEVVERGNARSWRFLDSAGVFDRVLPELTEALRDRGSDGLSLDPLDTHRVQTMERLRMLDADDPLAEEIRRIEQLDLVFLSAFLVDITEDDPDPDDLSGATVRRLGLPVEATDTVLALVADRDLLWSAAHRPGGFAEEPVLQLAAHLDTPERARALYALTALRNGDEARWELQRLRELHGLVQSVLGSENLGGREARSLAELHAYRASQLLVGEEGPSERLAAAPRAYVVRTPAGALARHARLLHPTPAHHPRVTVSEPHGDHIWVEVAWRDRPGLLAAIAHGLWRAGLPVDDAVLATWPDGAVLDSFRVPVTSEVDTEALAGAIEAGVNEVLTAPPMRDAELEFDQQASPWHTVCEVRATDRPGLLAGLATAFAASGITVRSATMRTEGDLVIDRFEVTERAGAKLGGEDEDRLRNVLRTGATVRRRRIGRRLQVRATSAPR